MKKIIIANWKANLSLAQARSLAKKLAASRPAKNLTAVLCPDFVALGEMANRLKKSAFLLGAQDCSAFLPGAHTGEVAAAVLKQGGVKYVIIGHSERRANGENSKTISQKIQQVVAEKLIPIICVGETAGERRLKKTKIVLAKQLQEVLAPLPSKHVKSPLIFAYEPVWAIGSGLTPEPLETAEICAMMKNLAAKAGFSRVTVIYGGSVTDQNAGEYLQYPAIAGLLVGGASLDARRFRRLLNF